MKVTFDQAIHFMICMIIFPYICTCKSVVLDIIIKFFHNNKNKLLKAASRGMLAGTDSFEYWLVCICGYNCWVTEVKIKK